jgi:hypothetical protein
MNSTRTSRLTSSREIGLWHVRSIQIMLSATDIRRLPTHRTNTTKRQLATFVCVIPDRQRTTQMRTVIMSRLPILAVRVSGQDVSAIVRRPNMHKEGLLQVNVWVGSAISYKPKSL